MVNCRDNMRVKNLYIISVKAIKGRLNRLPSTCVGDMVMATVKKEKPDLKKKVMPMVIVRQNCFNIIEIDGINTNNAIRIYLSSLVSVADGRLSHTLNISAFTFGLSHGHLIDTFHGVTTTWERVVTQY
ncbi:hypothetical protein COCNU_08G009170 [Cocos nucifera]|uniref:Ribosomal protein L14 n=1 Tax=Cocos nucifera TaxID=13894 RepID=A0A8K0N6G8_COCNU|nr:hypothetical protein COCNU_08G009170 [Cocos nucifera]